MIEAFDLHKSYGPAHRAVHALRGLSVSLRTGTVTGLLGPNGAGKSTSIRLLTGRLIADRGTVTIAGRDINRDPARARASIGYLPESAPLYPEMTPAGYLAHRAALSGMHRRGRARAIAATLARCDIADVRRRRIGTLSKGYRQRVALAAALIHDPPVLILDEPTTGLDPAQVAQLRALIEELARDRTVLLSSHVLAEVEQTCDRILIIAGGELRADGTPAELAERAAQDRPAIYHAEYRAGASRLTDLRSLPGVTEADQTDLPADYRRITLHAEPGTPDLRELIAGALVGCVVRELTRERPTLEDAFAQLSGGAPIARKQPPPATHPQPAAAP